MSYIRGNTVIGRSIMQLMVTDNEVNMGEIPVCLPVLLANLVLYRVRCWPRIGS